MPKTIQLYLPFLMLRRLLALQLYFYELKMNMYHDIQIFMVHHFVIDDLKMFPEYEIIVMIPSAVSPFYFFTIHIHPL